MTCITAEQLLYNVVKPQRYHTPGFTTHKMHRFQGIEFEFSVWNFPW